MFLESHTSNVVLVITGLALALHEETGLIRATFFLAALIFVTTSVPGIDAAVTDERTVSIDADAIDVAIMKL